MPEGVGVDQLMESHKAFDQFVYTPLHEAIDELLRRRKDAALTSTVKGFMGGDVPSYLESERPKGVLFRQISTPNHEVRRFFSIMDSIDDLDPLLGEHRDDRFSTANEYKCSWGRIMFNKKVQDEKFESRKIMDFGLYDGKPLSSAKTLWGQDLIEFHHELFPATYRPVDQECMVNISPWLRAHGGNAKEYYKPVLAWFLRHGILFENFMIGDGKEHGFTKHVFLPAFIEIYRATGVKPLIVNLLPTTIEGAGFWLCHPASSRAYIEKKLEGSVIS